MSWGSSIGKSVPSWPKSQPVWKMSPLIVLSLLCNDDEAAIRVSCYWFGTGTGTGGACRVDGILAMTKILGGGYDDLVRVGAGR